MTERTVLVTGGAGFVGSHTCKALWKTGYRPVVYDDLSNGHRDAVKWGPLEIGRLQDEHRLAEVMRQYSPMAVLHFAGAIEAGASVHEPWRFYDANVTGSLALLRAMRHNGVATIVFSSSAAVYGEPSVTPIPENHDRRPETPYGRSKAMVEDILADHAAAYELRYCALRYFNAAGADPDGDLTERHTPETHLIPLVIEVIRGQREAIEIYGTDYNTPDGTCIRDFVHVSDLARAHVQALENGCDNLVANLGLGYGFSVREVIEAVREASGVPVRTMHGARRPGDPAVLIADSTKARRQLEWCPEYGHLAEHVRHALNSGEFTAGAGI